MKLKLSKLSILMSIKNTNVSQSIFHKQTEKQIIKSPVLSFMEPPMGWMSIIAMSQLLGFDGLLKVILNPFFYL